ncbi:DIP1984 family protein [Nakamurella deserti]|uniref:DIP1984 family protein n=1 Tax=Nakamurella deserti TaxID=2164074 RepID=UPI000DBE0851
MKLAEALMIRADLQRRVDQLRSRIVANARFQEGEEPSEDAAALIVEVSALLDRIESLVVAVNLTNAATRIGDGRTMTAALAHRETLRSRHSVLTSAANAAHGADGGYRQMRSELRQISALPVAELRRRADDTARDLRELDVQIQRTNWEVDLREEDA